MRIPFLAIALFCTSFLVADEDEEDSVFDQMRSSLDQKMEFSDVKITDSKNSRTLETKKGNANISVTVDNFDQMSQLKYDWEQANPKDKKEDERKATRRGKKEKDERKWRWKDDEDKDEEEKESNSPSFRASIKWGE